ncbi:MAG: glutamine--tRNA ligase/YqeY domain fusion protein [Syntrophorhabdaceae bacterium]|nr:glutamine--tRNA ligase/YqeY domain fusion protein [Syntrophorhabdaceae bacterium]
METEKKTTDFLREIVKRDTLAGVYGKRVVTRFPPEPNGYLHIGHAKSICLNFGIANEFGGICHLRMDDTNPETEDMKYVESITSDVRWLGFDWRGKMFFASDYYERFYEFAVRLIREGKAYVDSLDEEQIRQYRGTILEPGKESPYRSRSVEENLDLFARMRAGEFSGGAHVLRARIDMSAKNMKMRDPILYRIRHETHYRRGDDWCLYPMYDFAHPLSDAIEEITHSICTLEFENNRAVYDWLVDNLFPEPRPRQYEFARLNLDYTVMSKRKLLQLVEEGFVSGWDDPRMPTIAGMRRRGYTPEGIRLFAARIGVDKANSRVSMEILEDAIRDDLNSRAPRVMAVLRPLKVTITDWPDETVEYVEAPFWPHDVPREGSRSLPLSRELYIEQTDFSENPPDGWMRLRPGGEARLRSACVIRCDEVVKDPVSGELTELRCSRVSEEGEGGKRKRIAAIQWVSAAHAVEARVRLYDRLFTVADPDIVQEGQTFKDYINSASVELLCGCLVEPWLAEAQSGERFQFVRHGYFIADAADSKPGALVFNRIVELKDTYREGRTNKADASCAVTTKPVKPAGPKPRTVSGQGTVSDERARSRAADPFLAGRYDAYVGEMGLPADTADVLTGEADVARFFDAAVAAHPNPKTIANLTANDVLRELKGRSVGDLPFSGADLADLARRIDAGNITTAAAKTVFAEMMSGKGAPGEIISRLGLDQAVTGSDLSVVIDSVLASMPDKVEAYKNGKASILDLFTGHVMKATGGKANPKAAREEILNKLAGK